MSVERRSLRRFSLRFARFFARFLAPDPIDGGRSPFIGLGRHGVGGKGGWGPWCLLGPEGLPGRDEGGVDSGVLRGERLKSSPKSRATAACR